MTKSDVIPRAIEIPSGSVKLAGILVVPRGARGVILFTHGTGSGRLSPRNTFVARVLQKAGFATLLFDLLTPEEENNRANVFDITLLAQRLGDATRWVQEQEETKMLPLGYFGASTGSAAAISAAAKLRHEIRAIVSRGGRPDLAADYLPMIKAPMLLIVGGNDEPVVAMNREAYELLAGEKNLVIIPGATHLFEEPGAMEQVAQLAAKWFVRFVPNI